MKDYFTYNTNIFFYLLVGLSLLLSNTLNSQNTNNEQVKRLQRAIFIFNFAEQVTWQNQEEITDYKIGVLGADRTYIDLNSLSQRRQIKKKPVSVIRLNSVKDVKDVQILYVNKAYNFDVEYVLTKIANKNILLISEDYNYKSSMINMVNVGDSFEYEINERTLNLENFKANSALKKHAISTSEKWKKLYKTTEAVLKESKKSEAEKQAELDKRNEELENRNKAIKDQKDIITSQKDSINEISYTANEREQLINLLSSRSDLQEQKLESKIALERELEKTILEQVAILEAQEEKINLSKQRIQKQTDSIAFQNSEIDKNASLLKKKNKEIVTQQKFNYLLTSLIFLSLLGAFLIYRNYKISNKNSKVLKDKNIAILKQSLELEAKNNELEQFAYIASHDLKEPLVTISSLIDLLVDDYTDTLDEEGKMSLNFVKESSDRMRKLIDAILAYSRLGKSKAYSSVDCNVVIETLKGDLQHVIKRTNTQIEIDKLPIINGAELEIRLLFQNLISNGIKFTKPDVTPLVSISAKKVIKDDSNFWQFAVSDNGIGIPEKHQERIFSIFQRLHSREEYEGTGIGLAHCKKIVESHGGKIWLSSEEGKGTTFYFTVPD